VSESLPKRSISRSEPARAIGRGVAPLVGQLVFRRSNNYTYAQAAFFRRFFGFVHPGEISSNR